MLVWCFTKSFALSYQSHVVRRGWPDHSDTARCAFATQPHNRMRRRKGSLPAHPKMSHTLIMNNILEDEAGLGRGYCPSRRYPLRFGKICMIENMRLTPALPMQMAPKKSGWKVTTNSVEASRFGQQNVSSRGDAIMWRLCLSTVRREKEKEIHSLRLAWVPSEITGWDIMCPFLIPQVRFWPRRICCNLEKNVQWYLCSVKKKSVTAIRKVRF